MTARNPSWREVANILASRMQDAAQMAGSVSPHHIGEHSGCRHSEEEADPENCPFCADRAAYQVWQRKAGLR